MDTNKRNIIQNYGGFETRSFIYHLIFNIIKWPMIFWGFIVQSYNLYILKKQKFDKFFGSLSIFEFSSIMRTIRDGACSWKALNIMYNWDGHFGIQNNYPHNLISDFWMHSSNSKGLRNRLRIIIRELKKAIKKIAENSEEIRLLSIASGSAQSIFLAVKALRDENFNKTVKLLLLDLDSSALENSLILAKKFNFPHKSVITVNTSTASLEKSLEVNKFYPNIIEMAGFLDYRSDPKAIKILQRIHQILPIGGFLITCNIHPNYASMFEFYVLRWPMIYRNMDEFIQLIERSGNWEIQAYTEPNNLHTIAVCSKI